MGCGCVMPRFFVDRENISDNTVVITGEDAKHISLSLRSKVGEAFDVCDGQGCDYACVVSDITKNEVVLEIKEKTENLSEPDICVTLYQAFVKSDKFENVVQKSVELGVSRIVPVLMQRCVSRPDDSGKEKKKERWNKIAKEAAMQSGRGIIPTVCSAQSFDEAIKEMQDSDVAFVCYENSPHIPIDEIYNSKEGQKKTAAILVGPEGGISEHEAKKAAESGIALASLGKRILRTETAPLCALSALMLVSGNLK